jgi:polar amino acid transport system permease protein
MEELISHIYFICSGVLLTLALLFGGLLIGTGLGLCFAILRYKNIAPRFIKGFISIIRGTPLLLQLSFIYFALPQLAGIKLSILYAGMMTFGLNSSAYVAEILRAGIESVPHGQFEAAKVLQIPTFYMWRDIILPQVIKNIAPALINETITLLKETALISMIGGMDIMRRAQALAAEQFSYFTPLCIAAGCYYVLVLGLEYIGKMLEARLAYGQSKKSE